MRWEMTCTEPCKAGGAGYAWLPDIQNHCIIVACPCQCMPGFGARDACACAAELAFPGRARWGLRGPKPRARGSAPWTHFRDVWYATKVDCFRVSGRRQQASSRASGNKEGRQENEQAHFLPALSVAPVRFAHRPRGKAALPGSGGRRQRFLLRLRLSRRKMLPSLVLSSASKR